VQEKNQDVETLFRTGMVQDLVIFEASRSYSSLFSQIELYFADFFQAYAFIHWTGYWTNIFNGMLD